MRRLVLVADASPVAAAQLVAQAFGEGDANELLGERADVARRPRRRGARVEVDGSLSMRRSVRRASLPQAPNVSMAKGRKSNPRWAHTLSMRSLTRPSSVAMATDLERLPCARLSAALPASL